jgi:hypothetical protein
MHERFPRTFSILITGHAENGVLEAGKDNGFISRILYKPWSEKELLETISAGLAE